MYVGIDLGTTSSECCWINEKNEPVVIPAKEGSFGGKNFPSVVAFKPNGDILVGHAAKRSPYEKVSQFKRYMGTDWKYKSKTINKEFTPQELSAFVLRKIIADARDFLNTDIKGAVVTVPAYFNDNQRQATKDACRIAGLNCVRLVNEPTAACISYGLGKEEHSKVIVLDLGGGTFDVTIMEIDHGTFQVLATSGDTQLGGADMDKAIYDYLIKDELDEKAKIMVMDAIERAKMELSSVDSTYIYVPNVVEAELTRAEFESIIQPILERLETPINQALKDAMLSPSDVDKVVLIGGATKTLAVRKKFAEIFSEKKIVGGVDPMRAVAIGAAIVAAVIEGRWQGEVPLLIDVTPLSLGVEVRGGMFSRIINRNTPIPVRASKLFTTTHDNQTAVAVRVYQGEREFCKDNIYLGEIILDGILPAPAGVPKIEVTFEIDENGILVVTAKDLGTNKERQIRIEAPHRLSEEEIQRIIKEAEMHEKEDKERRKEIELRVRAEGLIKAIENLPDEYKKDFEDYITKLEESKGTELEKVCEEVEKKLSEIAKKLYKEDKQS